VSLQGEQFRDVVLRRAKEVARTTDALLAAAGGPSTTTMTTLRRGDFRPRNDSMVKFDQALRWEPGSAWRVWNGGRPTPLPSGGRGRRGTAAAGSVVEFVLTGHQGVRVVVKGPIKERAALEDSVARLVQDLDDS